MTVLSHNAYLFASFWWMKFFLSDNQRKKFLIIFGALVLLSGNVLLTGWPPILRTMTLQEKSEYVKGVNRWGALKGEPDTPFLRSDHRPWTWPAALQLFQQWALIASAAQWHWNIFYKFLPFESVAEVCFSLGLFILHLLERNLQEYKNYA